jgi:hypothetical protein
MSTKHREGKNQPIAAASRILGTMLLVGLLGCLALPSATAYNLDIATPCADPTPVVAPVCDALCRDYSNNIKFGLDPRPGYIMVWAPTVFVGSYAAGWCP